MSNNIVELAEKITFGKFKGYTGLELLTTRQGVSYLVYIYKHTDIRMDARIVNTLVRTNSVKLDAVRLNSRFGGFNGHAGGKVNVSITSGGNLSEITNNPYLSRYVTVKLCPEKHDAFVKETKKLVTRNINVNEPRTTDNLNEKLSSLLPTEGLIGDKFHYEHFMD